MLNQKPMTASQMDALGRIPEAAEVQFPKQHKTVPASQYTDTALFEVEDAAVFKRVPVIVGPSAKLPGPRSYFQQDMRGMPVLVTRDAEGKVHAFANVCRHRGSKLCTTDDPVEGSRIVCAYHAWTYALDGKLIGVPRAEVFPGLDKSKLGLVPLPCAEAGGLIWVGLDPKQDYDFSVIEGPLSADLDAMDIAGMHIYRKATFAVQANWKLIMDTMLDNYHVMRLHKDSLARFFVDTENIVDQIGPHIRAAAARGNFKRELVSDDFEKARQIMVFSYVLFPNGIVVVSPEFVSVAILRPVAHGHTDVDYYMLTNGPAKDEKTEDRYRRSFELMDRAFGQEDFWAAEMCFSGLSSGAVDEVHLGGMEVQISLFHDAVKQCLDKHAAANG